MKKIINESAISSYEKPLISKDNKVKAVDFDTFKPYSIIKNTASGECILRITDSAEEKLQELQNNILNLNKQLLERL